MSEQGNPALARMMSAAQGGVSDTPRSISRALRLGLARAAGDGIGLPLSVIGIRQSRRQLQDLAEVVENHWLLLGLRSQDGRTAAICLDVGIVSAIVQQQTIGSILSDQPTTRAFTATDAAMSAPLVEDMLTRASALAEAPEDIAMLSGFEVSARAEDARELMLAMADEAYRAFDLTVEVAGGLRQANLLILLPDQVKDAVAGTDAPRPEGPSLDQVSGVIRADLTAVIGRVSVPLHVLSGLSAGDILPLHGADVSQVDLMTIERVRVGVGRLGQCRGMRAVRVNESHSLPSGSVPELAGFTDGKLLQERQERDEAGPDLSVNIMDHDAPAADMILSDNLPQIAPDQVVTEITQLAGLDDDIQKQGA